MSSPGDVFVGTLPSALQLRQMFLLTYASVTLKVDTHGSYVQVTSLMFRQRSAGRISATRVRHIEG